jgi:hypothetical protein
MLPVQKTGKYRPWGKRAIGRKYVTQHGAVKLKIKTRYKMFKFFLLLAVLAVALAGNVKVCLGCIGVKSA